MVADPALTEAQDERLREMRQHVQALDAYAPAELAELLASPALQAYARRVVEAVAALQLVYTGRPPDVLADRIAAEVRYSGAARKVSVSMPTDLTVAVQERVGRGKFSQYVTEAVTRQLERDLLADLSELLTAEHGPVPEEYLAEARTAWPDGE
jgi:Arc/MetJ-type ribon-helix-helix transcriptional regulator